MKAQLALGISLFCAASVFARGDVVFEGKIPSNVLGGERMIHVYVPPSYEREPTRRFPVLYLHDGQNVFSTAGSKAAFGWGSWMLDKTVDDLSTAGKMQEIIMVGVDCSTKRYEEYRGPAAANGDNTRHENYVRFLIEELKPKMDREYRTLPDAPNTGVMGSSMGGICSFVLGWEHPDVFGRAASLSGWYRAEESNFLKNVVRPYTGKPKSFRVYLDSGVRDFQGGDDCAKETAELAAELRRVGWRDGRDLVHFLDKETLSDATMDQLKLSSEKRKEAQRSQHNELYWRLHVGRALAFLFPPG